MEEQRSETDRIKAKWDDFHDRIAWEAQQLAEAQDKSTGLVKEPCNLCDSSQISTLFLKRGFQYAQCENCGLIFIYPQLQPSYLKKVYNDTNVRQFYFQDILLDFGETHQRPIYRERLKRIEKYFDKPAGRLLDFGCAAGNFMMMAMEQGWKTVGLELNQTYVKFAKEERNLDVRSRTIEDLVKSNETFDAVTMWDVPEHLYHPVDVLKQVGKIVKPNGLLATTTINHNCLNAKIFKADWRYFSPPDHVYSFDSQLITQILDAAGFAVIEIKHHYLWDIFTEGLMIRGMGDIDIRFKISHRLEALSSRKGKRVWLEKYSLRAFEIILSFIVNGIVKLAEIFHSGDIIEIYARKRHLLINE